MTLRAMSFLGNLKRNLNFIGFARFIRGDFSDATFTNRTQLQTNVTNGQTKVSAIPNGTGDGSSYQVWTSSTNNNCYRAYIQAYDGAVDKFGEVGMESVGAPTTPTTTMYFRLSLYGQSIIDFLYDGTDYIASLVKGQLKFPAVQVPSSNANTLDDYEEDDTASLTISAAVPGDLAISASTLTIRKTKIGRLVMLEFNFTFTPTFTTATGKLIVTGLEDSRAAGGVSSDGSVGVISNLNKVGYTNFGCRILSGTPTTLEFTASGSAVAIDNINMNNLTSGVSTVIRGFIPYVTT